MPPSPREGGIFTLQWNLHITTDLGTCKIPENSENNPLGLYFSKALFEGLIFGGVYFWRGFSTEGNLRFKIDWASLIVGRVFTVFALFYFVFTSPRGAYIWTGLYMEELIFGFLRYMLYRGSLPYFLLLLALRISFVIPRTSIVICSSLYRGATVVVLFTEVWT